MAAPRLCVEIFLRRCVIAHRLSTVKDCDLLLALTQGKLQATTADCDTAVDALRARPAYTAPAVQALASELVQ